MGDAKMEASGGRQGQRLMHGSSGPCMKDHLGAGDGMKCGGTG